MFYFTPLPGFFSPFPHGTCTLSVTSQYLALSDGPDGFNRDCTCPGLLGNSPTGCIALTYRAVTCYGHTFQSVRLTIQAQSEHLAILVELPQPPIRNAARLSHSNGLGSSPFARRY